MKLLPFSEKIPKQPVTHDMNGVEHHLDYGLFPERKAILVRRSKSVNGTLESSIREDRERETKSSPTSPKRVHFADANGLSLVEVKKFVANDLSGWFCPRQQFRSRSSSAPPILQCLNIDSSDFGKLILPCFSLKPCFQLPPVTELEENVARKYVCLENITTEARLITLICRVKNIAFEKSVSVRFTFDKWASFTETIAEHVQHSFDGQTDKFEVKIHAPKRVREIQFAIKYQANGMEYWDNNNTRNYVVHSST